MAARHLAAALLATAALLTATTTEARHRHRHHVRATPHRFVFATPGDADENISSAAIDTTGPVGDIGITGPTTADPYERPAVGYDITRHYGRGYLYPD